MTPVRDAVVFAGMLAATIVGVAAATVGIVALVVPTPVTLVAAPTPQPAFDVAVAPTAIGGRLEIVGDRTGTMELTRASGVGGRYRIDGDVITIEPPSDPVLSGQDGRITFDRDTGDVAVIEFDDLALYLDPGDCTVTEGAINEATELVAALVECPDVADVRGRGEVTVTGIVAVPFETVRGRGGLPSSGGTVVFELSRPKGAHETSVTFDVVDLFLDDTLNEEGRILTGSFSEAGGIAVDYDPVTGRFYLTQVTAGDLSAIASEPCPIAARDLGRISGTTRVVELEIDCGDMTDSEGEPVSVTGTIVADVIQVTLDDDGA